MDAPGTVNHFVLSLIIYALAAPAIASDHQPRSAAAKHGFQRENPCPSTNERRGKCPGYIIDHITPLCAGGPDTPGNMQWQTVADAKAKDRIECRQFFRNR